jgi:dTDP-glucose 4,6-dehydratase
MIANALEGKKLPVYGDGKNVRDWIHVLDHCAGIKKAMELGKAGEVYNFGGDAERENLFVVKEILRLARQGRGADHLREGPAGPRSPLRDGLEQGARGARLDAAHTFESGLRQTVDWYVRTRRGGSGCAAGAYQAYYQQQYGPR